VAPLAGWYPDPQDDGRVRWWDGAQWTPATEVASTTSDTEPGPDLGIRDAAAAAPSAIRPVVILLVMNLLLSIALTVTIAVAHNRIADFQLDAHHITDPALRARLRQSYSIGVIARALGNIIASIVYAFLFRALLRGRRWAYRRVIFLGAAGSIALLLLQLTPYPWWMRVEQLTQAGILGLLLYFVTRPAVKDHFDVALPGRDIGRFGRS
jgi:hypothetical protein